MKLRCMKYNEDMSRIIIIMLQNNLKWINFLLLILHLLLPDMGMEDRGVQELNTSGVEGALVGGDRRTPGSSVTRAEEQGGVDS